MQRLSKLTKGTKSESVFLYFFHFLFPRPVSFISIGSPFTYYYRGGFESKMSRREASLILNVRDYFSKNGIRDAHRRIMLLNHPDRGGSPFIASKINEAKALLEKDLSD